MGRTNLHCIRYRDRFHGGGLVMLQPPNFYSDTLDHKCYDGAGDRTECALVLARLGMLSFKGDYSKITGKATPDCALPDGAEQYLFR